MNYRKKTKIVATLGPATENIELIEEMILSGVDVFRINFSHADHSEVEKKIKTIRKLSEKLNSNTSILADLQGPKLRIGKVEEGTTVEPGDEIFFVNGTPFVGSKDKVYINYDTFSNDVEPCERVLLDDGKLIFEIISTDKKSVVKAKVIQGGKLKSKKGVNLPNTKISLPALTKKDIVDAEFAIKQDVDWIALSFVRNSEDILDLVKLIEKHSDHKIPVIAKIEKPEGIENIDKIISYCDGLMVARGDLGVEMPAEEVPLLQKELIRKANTLGIPIITATQMLDSMASNPRPTRAEVSDVANAILDGTDAVMLSNETAVGDYPVEAVETMATIARRIERDYPLKAIESHLPSTIPNAISAAVSNIARQLDAGAIIPLTKSGSTARNVSKFRPPTPILATTTEKSVARRLQLVWGVTPLLVKSDERTARTFSIAMQIAQEMGILKQGDLVVQTAGTLTGISGSTDLIKVGLVRKVVARGISIGETGVTGKARNIKTTLDLSLISPGEIIFVPKNLLKEIPFSKSITGIVTDENVDECYKLFKKNKIKISTICNVSAIDNHVKNGDLITLQLNEGVIYMGQIEEDIESSDKYKNV